MNDSAEQMLAYMNREAGRIEAEFIEERILAGDNRVVIRRPTGFHVFEVPRWRDAPLARLRIAAARWRHR